MTNPITPPPELVQRWIGDYYGCPVSGELAGVETAIATRAAQWGADQELEACCEWLDGWNSHTDAVIRDLRTARRPKPPSKAAQAEALIERHEDGWMPSPSEWHIIREGLAEGRRALEQLPE
jgi:hypothetical protein